MWQSCLGIQYNRIDVLAQSRLCFVVFGWKQEQAREMGNIDKSVGSWIRTTCYHDEVSFHDNLSQYINVTLRKKSFDTYNST